MRESRNNPSNPGQGSGSGSGGGNRRRRHRPYRGGGSGPREGQGQQNRPGDGTRATSPENKNREFQSSSRSRRSGGRPLTANQILVKYDNLLEQHLITRRKYFEYFNRVDDRQLQRLERNFFLSIEHLRRFEDKLEPWQREALEKRKTERYSLDLTYSQNRGWDPVEVTKIEVSPDEIEDPHFKESQKEAFAEYKEDNEESVGTYEDYLKLKGLT